MAREPDRPTQTDGALLLSDGAHAVTACQTEPGQLESAHSASVLVTIDTAGPHAVIRRTAGQSAVTNTGAVNFELEFTEYVYGLDASDLRVGGTATGAAASNLVGSQTRYTATVSGASQTGTVIANLDANRVQDVAGNINSAAEANGNVVVYEQIVGRYDFGKATSALEAGWSRVVNTTQYSASLGYGWVSGTVSAASRSSGNSLERDNNYTTDATFAVDLANGNYQVRAFVGDRKKVRDLMEVTVEGVSSGLLTRNKTVLPPWEGVVQVNDGQLTFRLRDMGGSNHYAAIAGLEIVSVYSGPRITIADGSLIEGQSGTQDGSFTVSLSEPLANDLALTYATATGTATPGSDFQDTHGTLIIGAGQTSATIHVPVIGDWSVESAETFMVSLLSAGEVWIADPQAVGTIVNDDFPLAVTVSTADSFCSETAGNLPGWGTVTRNGPLDDALTVVLGGSNNSELTAPTTVVIAAGESTASFDLTAVDDFLHDGAQTVVITASATGYLSGTATVLVTDDEEPATALSFDFGTSTSVVETGYQRVENRTRYTSSLKFGWQSGTINAIDRGIGNSVSRDFNYTADGTFAVDLPNGVYEVTVQLGDPTALRDRMAVSLEGIQVDEVSTNMTVVSNTYSTLVMDRQLSLRLRDLGGENLNVLIAGLTVRSAPDQGAASASVSDGDLANPLSAALASNAYAAEGAAPAAGQADVPISDALAGFGASAQAAGGAGRSMEAVRAVRGLRPAGLSGPRRAGAWGEQIARQIRSAHCLRDRILSDLDETTAGGELLGCQLAENGQITGSLSSAQLQDAALAELYAA